MANINLDTFFYAARTGNISLLKYYIDTGIDIHSSDDFALRLAIAHKQKNAIIFLLQNGASKQVFNNSMLRLASLKGETEIVKELLEEKTCDKESKLYAMYNAILCGYPDIVKLLLNDGLSPTSDNGAILRVVKLTTHESIINLFKEYLN